MLGVAALSQWTKAAEAEAALTQGAEAAVIAVTRVEVQGRFHFIMLERFA
jgi:hypothetical protein